MALGALAALSIPLVARSRRSSHWIGSSVCGAGAVAVSFYFMSATYNAKAFENPTYTGSLREANWIIDLARDGFAKAEALSERLKRVARNLSALYGRLNAASTLLPEAADVVRILHISDIHNNRAAVGFVTELADRMNVDAIIDTGDLTDLGLPVETSLVGGIAGLSAPYLFVAGNHDSQSTVSAIRGFPRSTILDGEPMEVAGLTILGSPDASSRRAASGNVDTPLDTLHADGERLLTRIRALPRPPDIVALHNPRQAEPLVGHVPLIVCGHMHKAEVTESKGTIICNAGTTGGAGVRYFDRTGGVPFTAAIVGFRRSADTKTASLAFIDQVSLEGTLGEYSITRKSFHTPEFNRPAKFTGSTVEAGP
jgi:predicted phosphodiesterase